MKDRGFKSKQITLLIGASILTVFILCTEFLLSQGAEKEAAPFAPIRQAVDEPMVPSNTIDSAASDTIFPISFEDFTRLYSSNYQTDDTQTEALGYLSLSESFEDLHLNHALSDGWAPTEILGYAQNSLNLPYPFIEESSLYVTSKNDDQIEVNVVGNTGSEAKTYLLSDPDGLWPNDLMGLRNEGWQDHRPGRALCSMISIDVVDIA